MEKISVLIPVYNREKYLEEAVRSIMNQTYSNLEIIIYLDGSTDNSINIAKRLSKEDNRIKIIENKENKGGVFAKVQLIKASTSLIICYQDSDDSSHPERIEKQAKAIEKNDLVYCGWIWMNKKGKKLYQKKFMNTNCAGSIMYKKDLEILPNISFNLGGGDIEFINMYLIKHPKMTKLSEILYYVRNHEDRIGIWKRKFIKKIPKPILKTYSYSELIKYYKEHHGK